MKDLDFKQVEIQDVIIHGVGNRTKEEDNFSSNNVLKLDESQKSILLSYYLSQFKKDEYFEFTGDEFMGNEEGLDSNLIFNNIKDINKSPDEFIEKSKIIAKQLYLATTHPKILSGDLHIVKFSNIIYKDEVITAIGLFKSETEEPFIRVIENGENKEIERQQGLGLKKVDRSCLILNTEKDKGYRILNVDKTKGEVNAHWTFDFLKLKRKQESYSFTNDFISMSISFADEVLIQDNDIKISDQVQFLQRTEAYLIATDELTLDNFSEEVIGNKEIIKEFEKYIDSFSDDYDIEIMKEFEISNDAVKENKKNFKLILSLDNNFKVNINGDGEDIEIGFDEARDMKFYKIYFKEEIQ